MAILCLSSDLEDLKKRLGNIIVAYRRDRSPVYCRDIKADGAMTVLLQQTRCSQTSCRRWKTTLPLSTVARLPTSHMAVTL